MKIINVAIVEDETPQAELLIGYLQDFAKEQGIDLRYTHYPSAIDAAETFKGQYDVLFLDIMMPGMTGMEYAHEIRKVDPNVMIIFVTSLTQFAIEGYEVEATDYLIKPLSYPEFRIKMIRAFSKVSGKAAPTVRFDSMEGFFIIDVASILYCETSGHCVIYHTESADYRKRQAMKKAEEELPTDDFIRINSCYLVAKNAIVGMENHFVILKNGERLLVSRPRFAAVSSYIKGEGSR